MFFESTEVVSNRNTQPSDRQICTGNDAWDVSPGGLSSQRQRSKSRRKPIHVVVETPKRRPRPGLAPVRPVQQAEPVAQPEAEYRMDPVVQPISDVQSDSADLIQPVLLDYCADSYAEDPAEGGFVDYAKDLADKLSRRSFVFGDDAECRPCWNVGKTGRVTSSKPAVQNKPAVERVRSLGRGLREGEVLYDVDLSRAEPTVLQSLVDVRFDEDLYDLLARLSEVERGVAKTELNRFAYRARDPRDTVREWGRDAADVFGPYAEGLGKLRDKLWGDAHASSGPPVFSSDGRDIEIKQDTHKGKCLSWLAQLLVARIINSACLRVMELETSKGWRLLFPEHDGFYAAGSPGLETVFENLVKTSAVDAGFEMVVKVVVHSPDEGPPDDLATSLASSSPCVSPDLSFLDRSLMTSGIPSEKARELGWRDSSDGFVIPFFDPETGDPCRTPSGGLFERTRLARPVGDCKYISPKGGGQFPYILPEVHRHLVEAPQCPVILTEGEKKAVKAALEGLPMIGLSGIDGWNQRSGDSSLHPLLARYASPGREFVMFYDSDGRRPDKILNFDRSANRFARAVEVEGCRLRRCFMPPSSEGGKSGVDDFLVAGGSVVDLHALVAGAERVAGVGEVPMPVGGVSNIECARIAGSSLRDGGADIYGRGGDVVCVSLGRGVKFRPLSAEAAMSEFEQYVRFVRRSPDGETSGMALSKSVAGMLLSSSVFHGFLPQIDAVLDYTAPCLDADGGIVLPRPGYDPRTKTFTNPDGPILEPAASVDDALELLFDILGDFPFVRPDGFKDHYRNAALVYLLSVHCHGLYAPERAPVFFVEGVGPVSGSRSGKDYLLGLGGCLAFGGVPPSFARTERGEESRKRLLGICREGAMFYLLSNLKGHLSDEAFEAAATSIRFSDRLLGFNQVLDLPNRAIFGITTNGLDVSYDLEQRLFRIFLTTSEINIRDHEYKRSDLHAFVAANRGRYLGALQTLVRNWLDCGCPDGRGRVLGFDLWSRRMGGVVEAAGLSNPIGRHPDCERARVVARVSPDERDIPALMVAWHDRFGERMVSPSDVVGLAVERELFGWMDLCSSSGRISFGKLLNRVNGRVFEGLTIHHESRSGGHTVRWVSHV